MNSLLNEEKERTNDSKEVELNVESMTRRMPSNSSECLSTQSTQLLCLKSKYNVKDVVNSEGIRRQHYFPSLESRQMHNQKERLRRSRIKCSCDSLRALVPGLNHKTDKASVLEHSVNFLIHLSKCSGVKCEDYLPQFPPPMSSKLLSMYPNWSSNDYHFYEMVSTEDQSIRESEQQLNGLETSSQVLELTESNGTQFVTTSDGMQYMIIDSTQQTIQQLDNQSIDCNDSQLFRIEVTQHLAQDNNDINCVEEVIDMLTDNKENIDPKANKPKTKRMGRKKKCAEEELALISNQNHDNDDNHLMTASIRLPFKKRKQKKALNHKIVE